MSPSEYWGVHNEWPPKNMKKKDLKEKKDEQSIKYYEKLLADKNLKELRDFAEENGLRSKDNSTDDLRRELLNELKNKEDN